jgi:hypothetical protein
MPRTTAAAAPTGWPPAKRMESTMASIPTTYRSELETRARHGLAASIARELAATARALSAYGIWRDIRVLEGQTRKHADAAGPPWLLSAWFRGRGAGRPRHCAGTPHPPRHAPPDGHGRSHAQGHRPDARRDRQRGALRQRLMCPAVVGEPHPSGPPRAAGVLEDQ